MPYVCDVKTKQSLGGMIKRTNNEISIFANAESEKQLAAGTQVFILFIHAGVKTDRKVHNFVIFATSAWTKRGTSQRNGI